MPSLGAFAQGEGAVLYLPVQNVSGATITAGYLVNFRLAAASFNANGVVLADSDTAADLPGFCGVARADIADAGYGLAQCYGPAASVLYSHEGSSITINVGDPIVPGALAGGGTSAAPTYANGGLKYILASNVPDAISASGYMSGLIRCF